MDQPSFGKIFNDKRLLVANLAVLVFVIIIGAWMLFGPRQRNQKNNGAPLLSALSQDSEWLAKKILPTVVRIEVLKRDSDSPKNELAVFFGDILNIPDQNLGSGIFIDDAGHVLTNYHVVRNARSIQVTNYGGQKFEGTVVGVDPLTDLAVVSTAAKSNSFISWANDQSLQSGSLVWAFGSPFGLDGSLSFGVVSSIERPGLQNSPFQDFIQTDVAVNPGSSGGPLVDVQGNVVGINTAIVGDGFQGVSFAIPSSIAKSIAMELSKNKRVERGWIGLELSSTKNLRPKQIGVDSASGVLIEAIDVSHGMSPAADAGLLPGDICLEIDEVPIQDPTMFSRIIAKKRVGERVRLKILRGKEKIEVKIKIGSRPDGLA